MMEKAFKIAEFATQAMLYEVSCFPSPGLVSPVSSGAHKDMDFYTFIDSTSVLNKYMFKFSMAGFEKENLKELFKEIRKIGIEAEREMFEKTGNINTHKGMIFLMGIVTSVSAYTNVRKLEFIKIQDNIKAMCCGLTKELKEAKDKKEISHGERLFLNYGILGVRGEAEKGIPLAFSVGLDTYEKEKDLKENDRLIQTLFSIMSSCDDSTILYRHDFETLKEVKSLSREFIKIGGVYNKESKSILENLNKRFIEKNISPGGSADILAITVLLSLVKKEFF